GDGGWGTTLAILLAHKGFQVCLWGAFEENINRIHKRGVNDKFLPGIRVPSSIKLTSDLSAAISDAQVIILAVPSQFIRQVVRRIAPLKKAGVPLVSVIKGIETKTLRRMSEVIYQELGRRLKLAVLSGPTIALEVAQGIPTTAVVAATDKSLAQALQHMFITDRFRVYTNSDVIGVELGGSLKNIIAIACGISDGLGFGTNTKAALLARGLAEMSRLGIVMGAKKETFSGISGLGDLVTTCISLQSRNRFVGEQIGKGKKLKDILSHMNMVAEGVPTAKAGYLLSRKYKVAMPITEQVYNVLYKNKNPLKAVNDLMRREKKAEIS
ncbi:MAG: glycerol-3-phosphate dehydrogenase, partial [Omnitrophica WOR_2 bacterium GWA2_44_7]